GPAKAAFFLREVGKGLTYLHDCGIVHRDLKPGNIFYENGYVKIGDYGLSKAMSMTRHSGQTVAVGTLHYMAPEIGDGKYDRSIDIYALGALLFELLTGQVPFLGSSPAEVLMKHLRSEVNLEGLEEPFKSVIRKAMAKNPDDRYHSVQEMVEAVFGSEAVRSSVSQFSPETLTMMAGQAARNVGSDPAGVTQEPPAAGKYWKRWAKERKREARQWKWKQPEARRADGAAAEPDRLRLPVRAMMAVGTAFLTALVVGFLDRYGAGDMYCIFWAIMAASGAAVLAWRFIGPSVEKESDWVRRLALGTPVALAAWPICDQISRHRSQEPAFACCAALFLICWNRRLSPDRKERVMIGDAFTAGLCGFIASVIFGGGVPAAAAIAVAVGTSLAVSLFSPWSRVKAGQKNSFGAAIAEAFAPFGKPPAQANGAAAPQPPPQPGRMSPPPIPGFGATWSKANPWSAVPGSVSNRSGLPPWAIVAIVLGVVGIVFGGAFRAPWVAIPVVIVIVFSMMKHTRGEMAARTPGNSRGPSTGSSLGMVASSAAHGAMLTISGFLLCASTVLALALVADLPGLLQSPLVNSHARHHLERALGTDWPRFLTEFGIVASIAFGWLGLLLMVVGRRRGGAWHILRGIFGIGFVFGGIAALGHSLPPWSAITPSQVTPGAVADMYLQHVDQFHAAWAGVIYLVGWVLLVWPGKRAVQMTARTEEAHGSAVGVGAEEKK
ncbi:MAG TPA: serine/threonine-protein kinase, partial [Acetobacteraceae bacterium]|nr:serine/threonine-protein kinase [Acetobacteraceae bacterium]